MKIYRGYANLETSEPVVCVDQDFLPLCLEYVNHSPTGFAWGYYGSGPSQLAFALLMSHTDDEQFSRSNYMKYKEDVIARIPIDNDFEITSDDIQSWIDNGECSFQHYVPVEEPLEEINIKL